MIVHLDINGLAAELKASVDKHFPEAAEGEHPFGILCGAILNLSDRIDELEARVSVLDRPLD